MAVRCSKCGEEVLGAANRCWKCGQHFTAQPDAAGLPPVRNVPLYLATEEVVTAEVEIATSGADEIVTAVFAHATDGEAGTLPRRSADLAPAAPLANPVRSGSPFVGGAVMKPVGLTGINGATGQPIATPSAYDPVAVAGAVGSIFLGGFALAIAWISEPFALAGASIIAMIGFGMGIWGLYSKRRGWALLGILISCAAIGLASYTGAMLLYESQLEQEAVEPEMDDGL